MYYKGIRIKIKKYNSCPKCGNSDIKFNYYFKEYYCTKCGWSE